jgi:hypothetical protein
VDSAVSPDRGTDFHQLGIAHDIRERAFVIRDADYVLLATIGDFLIAIDNAMAS